MTFLLIFYNELTVCWTNYCCFVQSIEGIFSAVQRVIPCNFRAGIDFFAVYNRYWIIIRIKEGLNFSCPPFSFVSSKIANYANSCKIYSLQISQLV